MSIARHFALNGNPPLRVLVFGGGLIFGMTRALVNGGLIQGEGAYIFGGLWYIISLISHLCRFSLIVRSL